MKRALTLVMIAVAIVVAGCRGAAVNKTVDPPTNAADNTGKHKGGPATAYSQPDR